MQKFVVKKISRSTNITLGTTDDTSTPYCEGPEQIEEDLDTTETSVRMCGYLKKKRNRVGGWKKMYFVLQNSLFLSYNSKDEYEKQLVSFKDIICLIPKHTVLIPSLEPRFTIASNLNTFYTFRCDDNRVCSKWITAILECLSRELKSENSGIAGMVSARNFSSQQNINLHPKPIFNNHSWENLPNNNWIVNHNGRVLLELNYLNYSRAKPCIPIGLRTAQMLQKYSVNSDVINEQTTEKPVNFIHDEKFKRNCEHEDRAEHFRLHNRKIEQNQSRGSSRINKMFESESRRMGNGNGNNDENEYSVARNEYSSGVEIQVKQMTLDDESGVDYSSVENYQSVDSKRFNNKLNIDTFSEYAEINDKKFGLNDLQEPTNPEYAEVCKNENQNTAYATVDLAKKKEERLKKKNAEMIRNNLDPETIYEDIRDGKMVSQEKESNIYEMIDIPLRPSRKTRSLVFKNWSRIHLFGSLSKRFNTVDVDEPHSTSNLCTKSKKASLTLTDISKHYRSMRKRAAKIYHKSSRGSSEKNDNAEN